MTNKQLELFPEDQGNTEKKKIDTTSTFVNNMSLPIHRWFRYSAGFSAEWTELVINQYSSKANHKEDFHVFDPFAGSGTTLIASDKAGVSSKGIEAHPFISKVARAKLSWNTDTRSFIDTAKNILAEAQEIPGETKGYPELIYKCYSDESLKQLDSLKKALEQVDDKKYEYELIWLTLVSILRVCSHVGTAQWQYVLPNKTKAKSVLPFEAFDARIDLIANDMKAMKEHTNSSLGEVYQEDARECFSIPNDWADLIVTSPPYANNYDYADATRLEMSFLGEVNNWGDLQDKVRKHLVRSCTQHVSKLKNETFEILKEKELEPIYEEIYEVCKNLEIERENHGGKKNYHTMIANYFLDMAKVWIALRRVTKDGGDVCFVIGDSAPYGVYVPVERWLSELAIAAGFKNHSFEKTRDRNIKWKNRKHRVPLKEGRLWIKG